MLEAVGHDLRDPINAIVGLVRLCLGTTLTTQQRDHLEKAHQAAQALQCIAHDIRDYSSLQSRALKLESIPFALEQVLEHVARAVAPQAQRKGIELVLQHPPHRDCQAADCPGAQRLCHLVGDPLRLGQVLVQLVGYAVQTAELGQVCLRVRPQALVHDCAVLHFDIVCGTDGAAESEIDCASALEAPGAPAWDSAPLGLRLSRALVAQMGGVLTTERPSHGGLRLAFCVRLQRAPELLNQTPAHPPSALGRVLVVEDNPAAGTAMADMLQRLGYCAQLCTHIQWAVRWVLVQPEAPRAVLVDWDLPDGTGVQATQALRALATTANTPVLIMGAPALRDTAAKHAAHSKVAFDGWLNKPVLPSALQLRLEQVLQAHQIRPAPPKRATPNSPPPPRLPGVHLPQGLRASRGDVGVLHGLLLDMVHSHAQDAHLVLSAYHQGDTPQAFQLVHTLKGSAAMLGAHAVLQAAQAIERALRSGPGAPPPAPASPSVATCCHRLDTALRSLERALQEGLAVEETAAPLPMVAQATEHPDGELAQSLRALIEAHNPRAADLLRAWLQRHTLSAPPWALALQQLDAFEFTSAAHTLAPWWASVAQPELPPHGNDLPS